MPQASTFTHTATYTYTRSELIADLVSGTFDRVLTQLGSSRTVRVDPFEEVLRRGWLDALSVVASSPRDDGSVDWHAALTVAIDAATHKARLEVDSEQNIELDQGRADDIADRLAFYGQMFVKVVGRHRQASWECGLWWRASALGLEHREEFNEITGTHPVTSHRGPSQKLGQYSPEEIDEATFGLELFTDVG
jgi:hypothetical protein